MVQKHCSRYESIIFTIETEKRDGIPILDGLVHKYDSGYVKTKVYRKPTHTGHHARNHPYSFKDGMVKSVYDRAKFTCSKEEDRNEVYRNITITFRRNGYHNRTLSKTRRNLLRANNNKQPEKVHTNVIPYVIGLSEKFRRIRSMNSD